MTLSRTNQLLIAAAGAGKTYELVTTALSEKSRNVVISTFTINNTNEIRRIFYEKNSCIPGNVTIKPWFTLLLEHFVRPFQGVLCKKRVSGVYLVNGKSGVKDKGKVRNVYWPEAKTELFYFDKNHNIYSDKISKFALKCNELTNGAVIDRFISIFDCVYIDEAQDLAGYDLEIIKLLLEKGVTIILVGDPRQVAYHTHFESKYRKYAGPKFADFFSNECKRGSIDVYDDKLNSSQRCVLQICNFADRLFPDFRPTTSNNNKSTDHDGVFFIRSQDVQAYLRKFEPMQLRWAVNNKVDPSRPVMNFGDSKGKSFERVLIYPTDNICKWLTNDSLHLSDVTRSKFYIAITRARQSVGIVINEKQQKKVSGNYWQPNTCSSTNLEKSTESCNNTVNQLPLWSDL